MRMARLLNSGLLAIALLGGATIHAAAPAPAPSPSASPKAHVDVKILNGLDDRIILLMKDKQDQGKVAKWIRELYRKGTKSIRDGSVGTSVDVLSFENFGIGVMMQSAELGAEEIHRDADKVYGDFLREKSGTVHQWARFKVGVNLLAPLTFTLPNAIGAVGVDVGSDVLLRQNYTLTVPTQQLIENTDGIIRESWARVVRAKDVLGSIRIPRTASRLTEKYPAGTEIASEGAIGVLIRFGGNAGLPVAGFQGDAFALVLSRMESKIRILHGQDRKLVRFTLRSRKDTGEGLDLALKLGVTVFRTSLLDGVVNANLFSLRNTKLFQDSLVFDYTYDLSYPEAAEALGSAFLGDLRPTQGLAIFREDEGRYRGVVVNQQHWGAITSVLKDRSLGLAVENSGLKRAFGDPSYKPALFGLLFAGKASESSRGRVEGEDFQGSRRTVVSYDFRLDRKEKILFGLLGNEAVETLARAQIIESDGVGDDGLFRRIRVPRVSYYTKHQYNQRGRRGLREFLEEAELVLGTGDKTLGSAIRATRSTDGCAKAKNGTITVKGALYGPAIRKILSYEETHLWYAFAKAWGMPHPLILADPDRRVRRKYAIDIGDDAYADMQLFERKFVPRWKEMKAGASEERTMELFRDILRDYGSDPIAFGVMSLLAGANSAPKAGAEPDLRGEGVVPGLYVSYGIDSSKCKVHWSRRSDSESLLGTAVTPDEEK